MTIDVAKLRSLARYQNDAVITAEEITELLDAYEEHDQLLSELLDAYEERDQLRVVLMRIRDKPGISARDHARLALEGRE